MSWFSLKVSDALATALGKISPNTGSTSWFSLKGSRESVGTVDARPTPAR